MAEGGKDGWAVTFKNKDGERDIVFGMVFSDREEAIVNVTSARPRHPGGADALWKELQLNEGLRVEKVKIILSPPVSQG